MQQHNYKVLESFDGAVITRDGELMHCAHNTSQQLSYARIVISRAASPRVFFRRKSQQPAINQVRRLETRAHSTHLSAHGGGKTDRAQTRVNADN